MAGKSYPRFATLIQAMVTLTNPTAPSRGTFFPKTPLKLFSFNTVRDGCGLEFYFKASFSFIMIPKFGRKGGNGLAFVVSATSKVATGVTSGVGYAGMDRRSMAVEFDTWQDKENRDTSANHVGINLKGGPFSNVTANVSTPLNNGRMYFAWVEYFPAEAESLKVFLASAFSARPDEPVLSMNLSLCDVLKPTRALSSFYFGFVAATRATLSPHRFQMKEVSCCGSLPAATELDVNVCRSAAFNPPHRFQPLAPTPPAAAPCLPAATGLNVDVEMFRPNTTSPFTRYVSAGYGGAQDEQDSWRMPSYSTWTVDPLWLPEDQGSSCEGCWAYAVVASIEAAYGIASNSIKSFPSLSIDSLYQLMELKGCTSGSPTRAFEELTIKYQDPGCYTGNLNHVVLVTGFLIAGTDTSRPTIPPPFWKICNSWGTQWGASGYMYMGIEPADGICGINVLPGIYPVIRTPRLFPSATSVPNDPCMIKAYRFRDDAASVMNPCGSFTCLENGTSNNCLCKPPFVEAPNGDGSRSCVYGGCLSLAPLAHKLCYFLL
ncbi:unnamed protein product [Closterium sp. Naga37s-1]|nr:unnamed protein product [Closterium sp. Naga37s-1]